MTATRPVCEWCGKERTPGNGDWGREPKGRYRHRPGRFCSETCNQAWHSFRRLKPTTRALHRLRAAHPDEYAAFLRGEEEAR